MSNINHSGYTLRSGFIEVRIGESQYRARAGRRVGIRRARITTTGARPPPPLLSVWRTNLSMPQRAAARTTWPPDRNGRCRLSLHARLPYGLDRPAPLQAHSSERNDMVTS
jgi:hypothetical protein